MFSGRQSLITLLFPLHHRAGLHSSSVTDCALFWSNLGHSFIWPWLHQQFFQCPTADCFLCHDLKNTLFIQALISCRDMLFLLYVGLKISDICPNKAKPALSALHAVPLQGLGRASSCICCFPSCLCSLNVMLCCARMVFACCKWSCVLLCCVFVLRIQAHAKRNGDVRPVWGVTECCWSMVRTDPPPLMFGTHRDQLENWSIIVWNTVFTDTYIGVLI